MSKASRAEYMKAWRAANAERLREYQREYDRTRRDPERHRERSRLYRQNNLDAVRAKDRARAQKTREARNQYFRQWREDNSETLAKKKQAYYVANRRERAEYFQRWYAENRARVMANARKRRVAKASATGSHSENEWQLLRSLYNNLCAYCQTAEGTTRDHIVPISKGGSDGIENIVPACQACNASKGARLLWEWKQRPKVKRQGEETNV